ncbi:hypothetical protein P2B10_21270, partial [Xanthomonas perforans]
WYDAKNRLTNVQNNAGATTVGLSYDPQGNLKNKNGQAYTFDYGNRLRDVTGKESYAYDAYGRRTIAGRPTTRTVQVYTQAGQLFYTEASGKGNMEYVYLNGSLLATRNSGTIRFQHTDALGSPIAVTDTAGQVVERTDYQPYGSPIGKTVDGIGYTGHAMDGATGLTYMQQRYYDQDLGRFLSVDPVAADSVTAVNFNRYSYATNNPYRFTDPDGRQSRDFEYISRTSGTYLKTPPRSEKDWLGPAIGVGLATILAAPIAAEAYLVAATNPAAVATVSNVAAEFAGITGTGVGANRLYGQAAERLAAKELIAEGNKILGSQVAARTSQGLRVIDHLVETPAGQVTAIEVKYGGAARSASQLAKDGEMATKGAVIVGKNAPAQLQGQRMVIDTVERRYGQ